MKKITAIILAAGDGTRMKLDFPKVLCKINGKEMIVMLIEKLHGAGIEDIVLVVGYKREMIMERVGSLARYVAQEELLGTGHAVAQAEQFCEKMGNDVVVLYGDAPFISQQTLKKLVDRHFNSGARLTALTAILDDPTDYGRIIRDPGGKICRVVEEKDASGQEKKIKEINTGSYCFDKKELFASLKNVKADNAQKEYYLTDVIEDFVKKGFDIESVSTSDQMEIMGINTQADLETVVSYYQNKKA